jgi:hypothetical protein
MRRKQPGARDEEESVSEYSGAPADRTRRLRAGDAGAPMRERPIRQRARFTPPTSASEEVA